MRFYPGVRHAKLSHMEITARCHPDLAPHLPPPVLASAAMPDWLGQMPGQVDASTLGGVALRTLKHCPPVIDSLRQGILLLCPTDIVVSEGTVSWDWDVPILEDADISRAPLGVHVPEQAEGSPYATDQLFIKFMNHWTLAVPDGWSLLFCHPIGYPDLPFKSLSGVVDCDAFSAGYVHFPAVLEPGFSGTIPRGTPIAQAIPVQKGVTLDVGVMSPEEIAENRQVQASLAAEPGHYRKAYRR